MADPDLAIDGGDSEVERRGAMAPRDEVETLGGNVTSYYEEIPVTLQHLPDVQKECLDLLVQAEEYLASAEVSRADAIRCRSTLARIAVHLERVRASRSSFKVVAALVYLVVGLAGVGIEWVSRGGLDARGDYASAEVFGVPAAIWVWATIGTLTSMLLRAGTLPFADQAQAMRWLLFRPIVGVVMGVMAYLLIRAGLIVLAQEAIPKTPELLWVIAFAGGFSDTFSVTLLEKLLGRFKPFDRPE